MNKKLICVVGVFIALLGIAGFFLFQEFAFDNPFVTNYVLDYPVFATGDGQGNHYVIDTAFRKVSKISEDGTIIYQINGGNLRDDSFFYASQIAVNSEGYLFLLDETRDQKGFYLLRERILLYSPSGEWLGVLYQEEYPEGHHDPTLVQRNRILGLEVTSNSAIEFFVLNQDNIASIRVDFEIENGIPINIDTRKQVTYPYTNAILYIADVTSLNDKPIVTLRDGTIRALSEDNQENTELLFSGQVSDTNSERVVPWEITSDSSGNIYFVDLEHRAIKDIKGRTLIDRDIIASAINMPDFYEFDYYRLDVSVADDVYTTNDAGIIVYDHLSGKISFIDSVKFSFQQNFLVLLWWVSILLLLIGVFLLIRIVYEVFFNKTLPEVLVQALAVIALVTVVGGISTFLLIDNFNNRYTDVIFQRISQMIQILSLVIDGDSLESIDSLDDFGGETYMDLRNGLNNAFNQNKDAWNKGYYFALYRIIDDRLYGFMYLNGHIGMYHPFDWLGGPEDPGIYDLAIQGEIASEMIRDISGEWIYGVGPIYNSDGEIIALFETGTDLYTLTIENRKLISDLVWELVTVWIVLMLLLIEGTVLSSFLRKRGQSHIPLSAIDQSFSDGNLARPLVFLYFTAISFSIAFLPLFSRDLYELREPIANITKNVAIALPLSLEMASFGVATVFTGLLTGRHGWRKIFATSFLFSGTGLFLSAITPSFNIFLLARTLTGLGVGMGYIALRTLINMEGRSEFRNTAYSNFYSGMVAGINVGLILGSSLSALLGYNNVFLIGLALLVITLIVFVSFYRDTRYFWIETTSSQLGHFKALVTLIKSPRLWMYFIFLLLPTYVASAFVGYFFPLYGATTLGLTTPQIGRFMIMNGLFIVYLGPNLSPFIAKRFGTYWGTILGSLLWGLSLVLAGITGNLITVGFILILMGATEGFAVSNQNSLFFSERVIHLVGQNRAVGYFELFGKVGDAIGPVLFATALLLGRQRGLILLGAGVALMGLLYLIFVRQRAQATVDSGK